MELLAPIIFLFLVLASTRAFRGWLGETQAKFNMWFSLSPDVYQRVHNVIIPSKNGTAQIEKARMLALRFWAVVAIHGANLQRRCKIPSNFQNL